MGMSASLWRLFSLDYHNHIKKFLDEIENLNIAVDFCIVSEIIYFDKVAQGFKDCNITQINNNIDGNFPGHEPNPLKEENLVQLKELVKKERADILKSWNFSSFTRDFDWLSLVSVVRTFSPSVMIAEAWATSSSWFFIFFYFWSKEQIKLVDQVS